mgnify:FL=1
MIRWTEKWLPEARDDMKKLGEPRKSHVYKAIKKVRANPLPQSEGGYGKPLGNRSGNNLTGLFKVKLRKDGIRIAYRLERVQHQMLIIIVGVRDENEVYNMAAQRTAKRRPSSPDNG